MALQIGTGAPDDSVGTSGDYYLRIDGTNRFFYGPKTTTWSGASYYSLQGPTGVALIVGTGAPSSSSGGLGQGYLNGATGEVYAKTTSGWGSPIGNITGARGSKNWYGTGAFVAANYPNALAGDLYFDTTSGAQAVYRLD